MPRAVSALLSLSLCAAPIAAGAQTTGQPTPPEAADPTPPASTTAVMPSFRSLFTDLPADVKRLPTVANAVWLAGAGALALGVHSGDATLTRRAVGSAGWDAALDSGATLGGGLVQIGGAMGTYVAGRLTDRPAIGQVGADLMRAQIINTVLTQGVKLSVGRRRPDGLRFSFPSGHSSSSFATATVLTRHFGWKAALPSYALATYVAGSRLTENKHFLSDVVFGAGIGIISGRAVTVGRGAHRFAVTPVASPGAIGVGLTRIGGQ